jgi:hypothetical protein
MKKKFDAVKFQRKVREELSRKYNANREAFLHELKEKYGDLPQRRRERGENLQKSPRSLR